MTAQLFPAPIGTATVSEDGRYRYDLTRRVGPDGRSVVWVMLNPSLGDAESNDRTLRRCIGYSQLWGFGRMVVVNLFAYRSPYPADLVTVGDPVGPDNDETIRFHLDGATIVVAAWGAARRGLPVRERGEMITRYCRGGNFPLLMKCLGVTKEGDPRHPLRLRSNEPLVAWP